MVAMGRLFTFEEIQSGQVPEPEEFIVAKQHFAESLVAYIDSGAVTGAFIYGSAAIDLANRRSDFDAFLSIPDGTGFEAAKTIVNDVNLRTGGKIPISPIVQTLGDLRNGKHEMDRFFGEHLTSGHRAVFGEDPADITHFPNYPAYEIVETYLAQKKRRLISTYVAVDPLEVGEGGLQRMLELPVAVGRKALQALAETGHIPRAVEKTADKRQVIQAIRKVLKPEGLVEGFDTLLDLNVGYNDLLDEAVESGVKRSYYEDGLREIHGTLPTAISWIQKLEENLTPKLKNQ